MPCLTELAPSPAIRADDECEVRRYLLLAGLTGLLWLGCEGAARCGLGKSPLGLVYEHGSSWSLLSFASAALFFACSRPSWPCPRFVTRP